MSLLFGKLFRKRPYLFGRRIEEKPLPPKPAPSTPRPLGLRIKQKESIRPNKRFKNPPEDIFASMAAEAMLVSTSPSVESQPEPKEDHSFFEGGSSGGGGAERSFDMDTPSTSND